MSNDTHSNDGKRNATSPSTIRSDKASNEASSGKSAAAREPQQGAAIDASSTKRSESSGGNRPDGSSQR